MNYCWCYTNTFNFILCIQNIIFVQLDVLKYVVIISMFCKEIKTSLRVELTICLNKIDLFYFLKDGGMSNLFKY